MKSFLKELFELSNKLLKEETAQDIKQLIYKMSTSNEPVNTGKREKPLHGDFAQVARHSNNEFHGYIFLDDNVGLINLPEIFRVEHLQVEERALIEKGHKTLTRFVDLCLSDISYKSNVIGELMSPYSMYKPINTSPESQPFLSDDFFQPAVNAFKSGKIYKTLTSTDTILSFDKIDKEQLRLLFCSVEQEINKSLGEDVASELKDFSLKLNAKYNNINDVLLAIVILMVALKSSLSLACHLLYRAICGVDLFVLNNDNIISIEKDVTTNLCHFYKVLSQDFMVDYSGSEMGSILLLDCDLDSNEHIHEFGVLISQTLNFAGEFGSSAKYSFVTINEELTYIYHLTDKIIEIGIPTISKK